jgi:hypothetical protein
MAGCRSPVELELMRKALHTRITQAIAVGEVTKDWSTEPPPPTTYVHPVAIPLQRVEFSSVDASRGWRGSGQDNDTRPGKKRRGMAAADYESKKGGYDHYQSSEANSIFESDGSMGSAGGGFVVTALERQQRSERAGRFRDQTAATVTTSAAALHRAAADASMESTDDFNPETLEIVGTCLVRKKNLGAS